MSKAKLLHHANVFIRISFSLSLHLRALTDNSRDCYTLAGHKGMYELASFLGAANKSKTQMMAID